MLFLLSGDGGAAGSAGVLRRDGGLHSLAVAPTPVHPAAAGRSAVHQG